MWRSRLQSYLSKKLPSFSVHLSLASKFPLSCKATQQAIICCTLQMPLPPLPCSSCPLPLSPWLAAPRSLLLAMQSWGKGGADVRMSPFPRSIPYLCRAGQCDRAQEWRSGSLLVAAASMSALSADLLKRATYSSKS